ncbi:MAG: WGR domain-containing protein [Myxococcales bacterium]|nr:WGR domain-containing protein [Myxococcales bacterium]
MSAERAGTKGATATAGNATAERATPESTTAERATPESTTRGTAESATGANAAQASEPKPAERTSAGRARRFELEDGKSSKFWEIALDGCDLTTRWGRIGTSGQSKTKTFASEDKARVEHDKLIAEKTSKGYSPA